MGKNIRPTIIYNKNGQSMQCTSCGIVKELNTDNFHKGQSKLGFKCRCVQCSKIYYKSKSDSFMAYQKYRYYGLKTGEFVKQLNC